MITNHRFFSGVVGCEYVLQVPFKITHQKVQIPDSTPDVVSRVKSITDAKSLCRSGDQLHQTLGSLSGYGKPIVVAFYSYDRLHQIGIQILSRRPFVDQRDVAGSEIRSCGLLSCAHVGEDLGAGFVHRRTHTVRPKRGAGKDGQNQGHEDVASKMHASRRKSVCALRQRFRFPVSGLKSLCQI